MTLKQWAIVCFILWISLGSYLAAKSYLMFSHDGMLRGSAIALAAVFFSGPAMCGVFSGGVLLTLHYFARNGGDGDSLIVFPWTSEAVKDITRHFTEEEKRKYLRHSAALGACFGIVCGALSISLTLLSDDQSVFAVVRVILVVFIYCISAFWMANKHKRFLSTTEYAKTNGIRAGQIKLVGFCKKR